jgi:autotransporter passenger strand-loop-strand repeat protein
VIGGGMALATQIRAGTEVVVTGGTANGATISSGLALIFGTASGTTLSSGAVDMVFSGAVTSATKLSGGSYEVVSAGGTAKGATVNGGTEVASAGATVTGTIINSGGAQVLFGLGQGTIINGGGLDYVFGTASGTILRGGYEYVGSGGVASGAVISAGTLQIASGGSTGTGAVTFSGGGLLRLDDSVHFGGLVAGFGLPDFMDLADISFVSGTTSVNFVEAPSNTSGTLTVGNGTPATTANITLLGQYATANFHIQNDGAGGTLVTDLPVPTATDQNPLALVNTHH